MNPALVTALAALTAEDPKPIDMGRDESTWLARMQARASRQRMNGSSKYVPHQGQREKARRLRQAER